MPKESVGQTYYKRMSRFATPNCKTIADVAKYLGIAESETLKALLFIKYSEKGEKDGFVCAFLRGDRELNMTKLINALGIPEHAIEFADEREE